MKTAIAFTTLAILGFTLTGCIEADSDDIQEAQQERILKEGGRQTGMPNIKNFRERKLMKTIIEMRDQDGLVTYTSGNYRSARIFV